MLGPAAFCVNIRVVSLELALWQWSNAVQISSVLMIGVLFTVLWRSVRRAEMRWWVYAWSADFVAEAVTLTFWYLQSRSNGVPAPFAWRLSVRVLYVGSKTLFLLMLLRGTWTLRGRKLWLLQPPYTAAALTLFTLVSCVMLTSVDLVGIGETTTIALALGAASIALGADAEAGFTWLRVGFAARALLALFECVGYTLNLFPGWRLPFGMGTHVGTFLAVHSSFDTGAEWLIALGCVIATLERTQRELRQANEELLAAEEDLRRLADRDPLTALANRRSLPQVFRSVQPYGAAFVFFDLNGFKQINDEHGHQAGDECLKRFAAALAESFRPQDAVIRYAGDEFLVVAAGLDASSVHERVETMRQRLRAASRGDIAIGFSYGTSQLAAGGQPEAALHAADEAMYQAKPESLAGRALAT
jgi:diguanylate cyclase (GGDEF)-like protein